MRTQEAVTHAVIMQAFLLAVQVVVQSCVWMEWFHSCNSASTLSIDTDHSSCGRISSYYCDGSGTGANTFKSQIAAGSTPDDCDGASEDPYGEGHSTGYDTESCVDAKLSYDSNGPGAQNNGWKCNAWYGPYVATSSLSQSGSTITARIEVADEADNYNSGGYVLRLGDYNTIANAGHVVDASYPGTLFWNPTHASYSGIDSNEGTLGDYFDVSVTWDNLGTAITQEKTYYLEVGVEEASSSTCSGYTCSTEDPNDNEGGHTTSATLTVPVGYLASADSDCHPIGPVTSTFPGKDDDDGKCVQCDANDLQVGGGTGAGACESKCGADTLADERTHGYSYDNKGSSSSYQGCPAYSSCLVASSPSCQAYDGDGTSAVCTSLGGTWTSITTGDREIDSTDCSLGISCGDGTASNGFCCGDDSNENFLTEETYSMAIAFDNNQQACCDSSSDCVAGGVCYTSSGSTSNDPFTGLNPGNNDDVSFCYNQAGTGKWLDCDNSGYMNTWCAKADGAFCGKPFAGGGNNGVCSDSEGGTLSGESGAFGEYTSLGQCGCCGDDANENYNTRVAAANMDSYVSSSSDDACCDSSTDCIDDAGCYSSGSTSRDADGDGDNDYCSAGTWQDCNTNAQCDTGAGFYCSANNCINSCAQNSDCGAGFYCDASGTCAAQKAQGGSCDFSITTTDSTSESNGVCSSGYCRDDYDSGNIDGDCDAGDECWCVTSSTSCAHNGSVYVNAANAPECQDTGASADESAEWICNNGGWQPSLCGANQYCSAGSCSACGAGQCSNYLSCRDGAICCDNDAECGTNKICVNEHVAGSASACGYNYQCRDVETISLGNVMSTQYSSAAFFSGGDSSADDKCGDHAYAIPAGAECVRYSVFDSDTNPNALFVTYDQGDATTWAHGTATGNDLWRYNFVVDFPDDAGHFLQWDIREYDTGFSDIMFGYYKSEAGSVDGGNSFACCDQSSDCVDDSLQGDLVASYGCYDTATTRDTGGGDGADLEYCSSGTWLAADSSSAACDAIAGVTKWNLGGEVSSNSCCGDDVNENKNFRVANTGMDSYASDSGDDACCDAVNDCVNNSVCYVNGEVGFDIDSDNDNDYCSGGTWYDCNTNDECGLGNYCNVNDCVPDVMSVSYQGATPAHNSRQISNSVVINVSVTSTNTNVDVCVLEWNGVNETMIKSGSGINVDCHLTKATIDGTVYNYNVYANNTAGTLNFESSRNFRENTKPNIPTLQYPNHNDDFFTNRTPRFDWSSSGDSDGDGVTYSFQLSLTDDFGSLIIDRVGLTESNFTQVSELAFSDYYWRVKPSDGYENNSWSPISNFTLAPSVIITLVNGEVNFSSILDMGSVDDTTDDIPLPFVIKNEGKHSC